METFQKQTQHGVAKKYVQSNTVNATPLYRRLLPVEFICLSITPCAHWCRVNQINILYVHKWSLHYVSILNDNKTRQDFCFCFLSSCEEVVTVDPYVPSTLDRPLHCCRQNDKCCFFHDLNRWPSSVSVNRTSQFLTNDPEPGLPV